MKQDKASELLEKYHNGTCNEQERAAVEAWYNFYGVNAESSLLTEDLDARKQMIWKKVQSDYKAPKVFKLNFKQIVAAACLLIVSGFAIYFYNEKQSENKLAKGSYAQHILPGKQGATLTLANGKKIKLTEATKGELAMESGVTIAKGENGEVVYTVHERVATLQNKGKLNELSTAKGETYQIQLPDGTKVWLNAASSLKFPTAFVGAERNVELIGEAYFEVSKNKLKPFTVLAEGTKVAVLGTHFNVMAYNNEKLVKTTLLEGAVQLSKGGSKVILKPGQEGKIGNQDTDFKVENVDATSAVAWKNGLFLLEDESLESIMRKIERWYDVEVVYKDVDKGLLFGGSVSRYDSVSEVLDKLELTGGLHFKIEGRRIIVMK